MTAPILAYPKPQREYVEDTDASDVGIGAVLSRLQDGDKKVIAYASKSLSKEHNYCVTSKELLALVIM